MDKQQAIAAVVEFYCDNGIEYVSQLTGLNQLEVRAIAREKGLKMTKEGYKAVARVRARKNYVPNPRDKKPREWHPADKNFSARGWGKFVGVATL